MALSVAQPPSAPHRWFSPPPMFLTGGPPLNPIITSSQDGTGTLQVTCDEERPALNAESLGRQKDELQLVSKRGGIKKDIRAVWVCLRKQCFLIISVCDDLRVMSIY